MFRSLCANVSVIQLFCLILVAGVTSASQTHRIEKRSTNCVLPSYPDNGHYEVAGSPWAVPGDELEFAYLNVTCADGSGVIGNNVLLCARGEWSTSMPECVRVCHLKPHQSVTYTCSRIGEESFGICSEFEPVGTLVRAECNRGFYAASQLPYMRCIDGLWSYVALCATECGITAFGSVHLPWYAYLYKVTKAQGKRAMCAANIINHKTVLTVAHCFWDESNAKPVVLIDYIITVGPPAEAFDFPVIDVKIPNRYQGNMANFQADIALVRLGEIIRFSSQVAPVCLDFDYNFKRKQVHEDQIGTLAIRPYPVTLSTEVLIQIIPYISIKDCITTAPSFKEYITSDKFCAGLRNNTLICKGNSGAGLSFPTVTRGIIRYYLRGLVSTVPSTDQECAPSDFVAFTDISSHEEFITQGLLEFHND